MQCQKEDLQPISPQSSPTPGRNSFRSCIVINHFFHCPKTHLHHTPDTSTLDYSLLALPLVTLFLLCCVHATIFCCSLSQPTTCCLHLLYPFSGSFFSNSKSQNALHLSCLLDITEWLILYTPLLNERCGCSITCSEEKKLQKLIVRAQKLFSHAQWFPI